MDSPLKLFGIASRGVNVVTAPTHLGNEEVTSAQNAELSTDAAEGGVIQRPGMTRINATPLGSGVLAVHDVPASFLSDYTPTLLASSSAGWRSSTDGTTWAAVSSGIIGQLNYNGFLSTAYWRNYPKLVTVGKYLYFVGQVNFQATSPIPIYRFDGTRTDLVSYVPPSVVGAALSTPDAPTVSPNGTTGATTYSYKLVARQGVSHSAASTAGTTTVGNATLSSTNYNAVGFPALPVGGSTSYDVYRTAGGATQGLVGTVPVVGGAFTLGNGSGVRSDLVFTDAGLTGDASAAPGAATGSTAQTPVQVVDFITDGTYLYCAVLDIAHTSGRILKLDPIAAQWTQILATFPIAGVTGVPSALAFFDGALSYVTYSGTTAGLGNHAGSTQTPLPAGGVIETRLLNTSESPACAITFNGAFYIGHVWVGAAGTAGQILQRTALTTWANARNGVIGTAQYNGCTTLGVFGGRLYAGWYSGDGNTAAVIESTADGTSWVTEITLDKAEVPCQMVSFNSELYVATAKVAGATGNTKSRIIKKSSLNVWSTADDPTDDYTGALGVVYI